MTYNSVHVMILAWDLVGLCGSLRETCSGHIQCASVCSQSTEAQWVMEHTVRELKQMSRAEKFG